MLSQKIPEDTGDNALGAGNMTARVIQDINKQKQLMAEPTPINIHEWDTMVCDDLDGNVETAGSSSSPEPPATPTENDKPQEQATTPTEPDAATRTLHKKKPRDTAAHHKNTSLGTLITIPLAARSS